MANGTQLAELRALIDDSDQAFDDAELTDILDRSPDVRAAAATVWSIKASRFAGLVDVTEGSSSRKMSQLYKQALEMSSHYRSSSSQPETPSTTQGRSGTRAITRL